jgi:copper transport protein
MRGPVFVVPRCSSFFILAAILTVLLLHIGGVERVDAHADLRRADPAPDALLVAPPRTLDLWLTEPIATGDGSPSVRLLDQTGRALPIADLAVDPDDPAHVRATVRGVGTGTYTVVWSTRSATDGHTITGSYAFRVASSTRAPGAATTEGDDPAAWAVATRWLTFLGAALIAGGFGIGQVVIAAGESTADRRRRVVGIVVAASVALFATLAEPVLQTRLPPNGVTAPSFAEALRILPAAWWFRSTALAAALLAAANAMRAASRGRPIPPAVAWLGTAGGLTALLGLSLTSHAAGRADWRLVAVATNVLHQWAVALWIGGLATLAGWWYGRGAGADPAPVRRFSRLALGLAIIGIATGALNAGFVLPRLRSLWSSTYGDVLLIKIAVVVPVLILATFHRAALRRAADVLRPAVRRTIRLETALAFVVIGGGTLLALLAPPAVRSVQSDRPVQVDLRQPILADVPGQEIWVHLVTSPAKAGTNSFGVAFKQGDGRPAAVDLPSLVRLTFTNLDQPIAASQIAAQPAADGTYRVAGTQVSLDGWWRIDVTVRWPGREDVVLTYYLLLPDPNLHGLDAPADRASDPEAAALFTEAMASYTGIHRVRYRQSMLDGRGAGAVSEHAVNDGSDGSPPGFHYRNITVNGWEAIVFGDRMWSRYPGEPWEESDGQEMIPPARWGEEYEGATGFRLGRIEEIDGEPCQVLTFVVPAAPKRVVAWYVWWVGTETGLVRRDAMISRRHYMINSFSDFDAPLPIVPPVATGGTPIATPGG